MDDEYPHELHFGSPFVISVSTAAKLLAYENEVDGLPSVESEDSKLVELRAHAFGTAAFTGNLLRRSEVFCAALLGSLERNEWRPVSVRRSLDGLPIPAKTWMSVDDLMAWAEVRELAFGDWSNQYLEDEQRIFMAAGEAGEAARRQLENPEQERVIQDRASAFAREMTSDGEAALDLIRENERLRAQVQSKRGGEDRPVADRERATLLNVIGALLHHVGEKEASIIDSILSRHPDKQGLTKRTLEAKFAAAKRSLSSK